MPMTLDMSAIFSLPTTASSVGHFTNKGKVGSLRWEAGKEVNRKWGINQQIKVILHSKPIFAVNFTPVSSTDLSGFVCCLVFQRPIAVVQGVPCLLPCDSLVRVQQPQPQVDSGGDQPSLAVRVEIQLNLNICYVVMFQSSFQECRNLLKVFGYNIILMSPCMFGICGEILPPQ